MTPLKNGASPATSRSGWTLDAYIAHNEALRAESEKVQVERDRVYTTQFKSADTAVSAALAAQEKSVNAAFAAAEKAGEKLEVSQTSYNAFHNDLARKMDAQYERMIPRSEAFEKFEGLGKEIQNLRDSVGKDIQNLRESRSAVSGKSEGAGAAWAMVIAIAGLLIGIGGIVVAAIALHK